MSHAVKTILTPVALTIASLALPARAQQPVQAPPQITVTGEGQHSLPPDTAIVTMAVVREGDTAKAALGSSSQAMREVLGALRAAGIAERDVQTSGLSIQPRYVQRPSPLPGRPYPEVEQKISGYSVSNQLTIRIRKIADAGEVIDKVVAMGANQGGGIAFSVDDPKPALTEARKRAVDDAIAKARTLADASGVKLGRVTSIQEGGGRAHAMPMRAQAFDSMAKGVPLASGESTYESSVTMTFEIAWP